MPPYVPPYRSGPAAPGASNGSSHIIWGIVFCCIGGFLLLLTNVTSHDGKFHFSGAISIVYGVFRIGRGMAMNNGKW